MWASSPSSRSRLIVGGAGLFGLVLAASAAVWIANGNSKDVPTGDEASISAVSSLSPLAAAPPIAVAVTGRTAPQKLMIVGDGDTLMDLLLRAGADRAEAAAAIVAVTKVYDPRSLKIGEHVAVGFDATIGTGGNDRLQSIDLHPAPGRQIAMRRAGDGFAARAYQSEAIRETAHQAGEIKTSLFDSAMAAGVPAKILSAMIRAYSYDVDFQRDIQPGDSFEVMYQRQVDPHGEVMRDGDILFAQLTLSGKAMPIYRYVDGAGTADFYNAKGESVRKALLRTPVDGARITSGFGMRVNPILGFSMMHKGVDFGVPIGTPVMAAGSGVIEYAGENGAYGIYARIRHDRVHSTAYAHLSALAKGTRVGRKVTQGQIIGYVGETGRSTGPHLHYEVLVNNAQVNPMSVKFKAGAVLAGRELARFKTAVNEDDRLLTATPLTTRVASARGD